MKLSGIHKAALLLITLGPDASSKVLKRLPENSIEQITYKIANMPQTKQKEIDTTLSELAKMVEARHYIHHGGVEYAKSMLTNALGSLRAKEIMDRIVDMSSQTKPFSLARKADTGQLLNTIIDEHPQTIALVLCYLQPEKAATIMSGLSEELQVDVAERIATMKRTSSTVISKVERILDKKLSAITNDDFASLGGVNALVDILNAVDRGTEKNILLDLEKEQPELAEEVRNSLFVFEDIVTLDSTSIQRFIREINNSDLALALKGSSDIVKNVVMKNLSNRAAEMLKEEIEFMGPVRLAEVEQAQKGIVATIRKLEETGEIMFARGSEDAIIQ